MKLEVLGAIKHSKAITNIILVILWTERDH